MVLKKTPKKKTSKKISKPKVRSKKKPTEVKDNSGINMQEKIDTLKKFNTFLEEVNKRSTAIVNAIEIQKEKEKLNKYF